MLFGDSTRRVKAVSGFETQSCFRCYSGPGFKGDDRPPCSDSAVDTEGLPPGPCLGGMRSNIVFPT